jgi:hypothetical protein
VHRTYANGVVIVVDVDDDRSDEPYIAVLDLDRPHNATKGASGTLIRVDAGWRGAWAFEADEQGMENR